MSHIEYLFKGKQQPCFSNNLFSFKNYFKILDFKKI